MSDPEIRLDELMHLAELCIEVTQQNEEYHSEVRTDDHKSEAFKEGVPHLQNLYNFLQRL